MDLWKHTARMTTLPVQTVEGYGFGVYADSQQFLAIFMPFDYRNTWCSGTVMYLIRQEVYMQWFDSIINKTADVYIFRGDQSLVTCSFSSVDIQTLLDVRAAEAGQNTIVHAGKKYRLLSLSGEKFDYSYMMLISDEELRLAVSSSAQLLILVAAVIASLGVLLIMRTV